MSDGMTLADLIERSREQRGLRDHAGSFDSDSKAPDSWGSPRGEWWPFIRLATVWADVFPNWRMPDEPNQADPP